jgi:hypothetical protein
MAAEDLEVQFRSLPSNAARVSVGAEGGKYVI